MNAQMFKSPSGEEMVILSRVEYDRLLDAADMASDVVAFDEATRALEAGEEEALPAAFINAMLEGESLVRLWRKHRGMTLEALARATGLSRPYLSQIETGKRVGGIDTLKLIASALGVTLDDLA
ncbi:MAG: helix-turn-helix transcriptional regulator [Caulobacter sp.]|nr:helix-turn-helix transcriptional regulator [Caulobacter sp.]